MPTYAYACKDCDHAFDIQQTFTEDSLTVCPQCEGTLRKKFNSVGVVFKGSGFYRTDSRDAKGTTAAKDNGAKSASGNGSAATSGSKGASGGSDSSSASSSSSSTSGSSSATASASAPSSAGQAAAS